MVAQLSLIVPDSNGALSSMILSWIVAQEQRSRKGPFPMEDPASVLPLSSLTRPPETELVVQWQGRVDARETDPSTPDEGSLDAIMKRHFVTLREAVEKK